MKGVVDPGSLPTEAVQILTPDGTIAPDADRAIDLKEEDLREIYRLMVLTRRCDEESTNLQRQGELGVYCPCLGQEAAQIGSAYALEPTDWIFPSYRELGPALLRGIDPADILHMFRGTWHGGTWDFRKHRFAPYCVPVGTQPLHAAGFGIAAKLDRSDVVVIVYFGDGATSEGDFHEGCNFAGVWRAPVVFFCQNNQYAISLPTARQTAAPTIASKALGYGFPGVRVDGNDVLAVHAVTKEAVRRAREGGGPTLIEAMTFRMGPHSTADDPTRYRGAEEVESWKRLDPIHRFAAYLERESLLTGDFVARCAGEADEAAARLREAIVGAGPPPAEQLFEHVYAVRPPVLERQLERLRRLQARGGEG
ncbi:MAG: pyruvate dehydrogenase (acetyl-transferring) E1 component subunit alpha [Acidobacteria bacterium]|nr:pyruvate dehydrogenase (acetyl-transferring) E1 component subunit alpha [Acidobacteriota bacterium]